MYDGVTNISSNITESIDEAVEKFLQERYEESNHILLTLVKLGHETSFTSFCVARNFLYLRVLTDAREWFARSLSMEAPFRWGYYELARLQEVENDIVAAVRNMTSFAESYAGDPVPPELNPTHIAELLRIAHRGFDIDTVPAVRLYRAINAIGVRDYLCELRIVEDDLDRRKIRDAHEKMVALMAQYTLDPWGQFALSRIQFALGLVDNAVATAMAAGATHDNSPILKTTTTHRLLEFKAFKEARAYCERELVPLLGRAHDLDCEIHGIKFRLNVLLREHSHILADCRTSGFLARIPNWLSVEALFCFALPGEQINQLDIEVATELAKFLETQWPYSLGTVLSLYQFYSCRRMWAKVVELEQRISADALFDHHEVVMRRFETLCAMSRMEEAKRFYRRYYADAELRQWEACAVLRFLAEAKMWDEAAGLLLKFIANRYDIPDGEYFLLRICRRTRLHRQIISLIEAHKGPGAPQQFEVLQDLLRDDLIIREGAREPQVREADPTSVMSPENRLLYKFAPSIRTSRDVGFLCADKAYFMSLLTFLASFVSQSNGSQNVTWYVFLAKDVPATWPAVLTGFASQIGLSLTVVTEEEFVSSDVIYVENYGIFTGGNTLSRAAFLRIYAARYLYTTGKFERACYMDSDIICQQGFADFLDLPFGDALLMARAEEPSPEVLIVTEKHGLAKMSYFNSGVLIFNFGNNNIIEHLGRAIHLSEQESDRLVFHDQCALNIAFAKRVRYLEPRYNYFLRPHRPDNGDFSSATLLHFLDKPKPWDVSYRREYRVLWLRYAEIVRMLLTRDDYNNIVMAANT
jgi:UDP-glucose:(glucosyl)LPS alpha-1,3-glucosyltransferase